MFHDKWAASSKFLSSSIPSWQILTAHAQPFRGARDLAFCLKVPLDSLLILASSGGSGETARMHRLAWTFAARIGDKYQIRLTRPKCKWTKQTRLKPHLFWRHFILIFCTECFKKLSKVISLFKSQGLPQNCRMKPHLWEIQGRQWVMFLLFYGSIMILSFQIGRPDQTV